MAWTTPETAVAGDVLTAAWLNQNVRDNLDALAPFFSTWTSYTPQIDQGASTNIAKTIEYAKYLIVNKTVWLNVKVKFTGTGSNAMMTMTFPTNIQPQYTVGCVGAFFYYDYGSVYNVGSIVKYSDGKMSFSVNGAANYFGVGGPIIAVNDELSVQCCYEIA